MLPLSSRSFRYNVVVFCRKEEAGAKTIKLKQDKEVHDRQQQADEEAQKNLEENLQQLTNRQQLLTQEQRDVQSRVERLLEAAFKNKNDHAQSEFELREMQDRHRLSK